MDSAPIIADAPAAARNGVHAAIPHDSAIKHVTGRAIYADDLPEPPGLLHLHVALSTDAHARLTRVDLAAVRTATGVV